MVKILYLIKAFLRNSFLASTLVELQGGWLRHSLEFRSLRSLEFGVKDCQRRGRNHKIRKILKKGGCAALHESQKSCSLLEMGTSPFLVRLRSRRSDKRTLAEHGNVPVRRSVHDCANRGKIHRFIAA